VVDDDPEGRELLTGKLVEAEFEVYSCGDAYLGLERVRENPTDIIVTDHFLPGMLGSEFILRVREFGDMPIIAMSARATIDVCDAMHRAGASRFLEFSEAVESVGIVARELLASQDTPGDLMTLSGARQRRIRDERTRYSSLVAAFDGNISAIARHMGVDRSTVQYHLSRLGLR
jgi:DNA-binding NtrC family response regulator